MNQGVFESSPVQQMMAGNPNWWNINSMRPPPQQPSPFMPSASSLFPQFTPSSSLPLTSLINDNQDLPESWSQLLLGGLVGEEDRSELSHFQAKKAENWEEQAFYPSPNVPSIDVKQEVSEVGYAYGNINEEYQVSRPSWSPQLMTASSPMSCVTSFSSNMLDFSSKSDGRHQQTDHSSECNSTATGGTCKKARVQPSTTQSTFKVRKEKLGDRITALHQLVSPFGKTDTASVLLEAIGYIRFLQNQIEALSSPYLGTGSGNIRQQQSLLNDTCMKRRRAIEMDSEDEPKKDLLSRGLCLVPVSCTLQVGSDNGADYWAPSLGAGFR